MSDKFRHGDEVFAEHVGPGAFVLLDKAPLSRRVARGHTVTYVPTAGRGTGTVWWLQDAVTGAVSTDWCARESELRRAAA